MRKREVEPSFNRVELMGKLMTTPEVKMVPLKKETLDKLERRGGVFKHEFAVCNVLLDSANTSKAASRSTRVWLKFTGRVAERLMGAGLKAGDRVFVTGRLESYSTVRGGTRMYQVQVRVRAWTVLWPAPRRSRKNKDWLEIPVEEYERLAQGVTALEGDDDDFTLNPGLLQQLGIEEP